MYKSMTSTNDPSEFSMDDSISNTPHTRSSSRNRKATLDNTKKNVPKTGQQRVVTRSSQKTPMTDDNDNSFMSNINSGFSQFINSKKRQRDEKKTKTFKRPKSTYHIYSLYFICKYFYFSYNTK